MNNFVVLPLTKKEEQKIMEGKICYVTRDDCSFSTFDSYWFMVKNRMYRILFTTRNKLGYYDTYFAYMGAYE